MKTHAARTHEIATGLVVLGVLLVLTIVALPTAHAQVFQTIYNFTGGADGGEPLAGLTMDAIGNLYGTTFAGGPNDAGTVFKLAPVGGGWKFATLYTFLGDNDGAHSQARLTIGPDGGLYGTTASGGGGNCDFGSFYTGCGTVFKVGPQPCLGGTKCPWKETVLHGFTAGADGALPFSEVIFDAHGNFYGTTYTGGQGNCYDLWGCGTVYEMSLAGGVWTENVVYTFNRSTDQGLPYGGLIFDNAGNFYGATACCRDILGHGTVFQLVPGAKWVLNTLYTFQNGSDGQSPAGTLIADAAGNLYGTTPDGGDNGGGTVFELLNNGNWTFQPPLYGFTGARNQYCGPDGALVMDNSGNLYGTTQCDGAYGFGSVFELKKNGGSWTYVPLYDFKNGTDGGYPYGGLVMDKLGNLYGTTLEGGTSKYYGVVFEVTP